MCVSISRCRHTHLQFAALSLPLPTSKTISCSSAVTDRARLELDFTAQTVVGDKKRPSCSDRR